MKNYYEDDNEYHAANAKESGQADAGLDEDAELDKSAQAQVYETFVREKSSILNNIYDLLVFAAKLHEIQQDKIFTTEDQKKRSTELDSKIKSDQDAFNIKNRVTIVLKKYQEQSSVLDTILSDLIEPIMRFMQIYTKQACKKGDHSVPREISQLFEVLYNLCSVRGYKTVVKFFPHEAADMEPCVEMLHFQDGKEYWIKCMLTLWLSLIVIVPFDI